MYGALVSDAKRTPYREPGAASQRALPPRGPIVKRADEPAEDRSKTRATPSRVEPQDPDAGVFSGLVSPHPASTPVEAWAQRLLTLIGLPLIVSTFVCVGWFDTRRAYGEVVKLGHQTPRPLGIAHPLAWLFGATPMGLACFAEEAHWALATAVIGIPFAALFARRLIRARILEREAMLELMKRAKRAK